MAVKHTDSLKWKQIILAMGSSVAAGLDLLSALVLRCLATNITQGLGLLQIPGVFGCCGGIDTAPVHLS